VNKSDARRIKLMTSVREIHAFADAAIASARAAKRRKGEREPRSTGPTKADRKAAEVKAAREHAKVYAAVNARSGGMCEFASEALICCGDATEHDHFWGRGKVKETPENVWHLCKSHHDRKTAWEPDRRRWVVWFRNHCYRNDFREEQAKCDRAIALETAQHPEARR
jgi:hypothetical protein